MESTHDLGLDRRPDDYRDRRNLLLGYRSVCHGPPFGAASQIAGGVNLPRRYLATRATLGGDLHLARLVEIGLKISSV
jgi:hypothetical protein